MKTTKVSYQFKKEAPNPMITELATLYTVEFISEKDAMKILGIGIFTLRKWYNMGLNRYKIDDKKFLKKSELNEFLEKFMVREEKVQHIKLKL